MAMFSVVPFEEGPAPRPRCLRSGEASWVYSCQDKWHIIHGLRTPSLSLAPLARWALITDSASSNGVVSDIPMIKIANHPFLAKEAGRQCATRDGIAAHRFLRVRLAARPQQVGSRTGAPALGFGGLPMAFAMALSPTPIATFPVPAASNRTCGFPASGFPTDVTSRHTPQGLHLVVKLLPMHTSFTAGGNRLTPLSRTLCTSAACPKSGPFPPPELPGFLGTTRLSATSSSPVWPSRVTGWRHSLLPPDEASRVAPHLLLRTCCRHYPGGIVGCIHRSLLQRQRPSLVYGQVGFRITLFEACSAFTARYGLCVRQIARGDPLHRRLQQLRHLHHCSDCYRLERPLPGGIRTH